MSSDTATHAEPIAPAAAAARTVDRPWWAWMVGISLIGLGIRIAAVLGRPNRPAGGDAYYYHAAANLLVSGLGFINPFDYYGHNLHEHLQIASWPPLFVGVLAMSSVVGFKTYFADRIWASIVGTFAVVVCGLAGRQIGGRRVGLFTALVIAIYPNIWMSDEPALSETITPLLVGFVLWAAYRFWKRPTYGTAGMLSLAVAVTALGRDELTLLYFLLVLPVVVLARGVRWTKKATLLGTCVLVAVLVIGPWVGYNLSRFSKPVFISDGLGVTLASANCNATYSGQFEGYWNIHCALAAPIDYKKDQSVQSAEAQSYALKYIDAHKSRWIPVALARVGRGFAFFRPSQQIVFDYFVEGRPYRWALTGLYSYYVLFAVSIPGAVILFRRRTTLVPLVGVGLNVVISMVLTFGQTRYRTPFEVVLAVLASVSVDAFVRALGRRRRRSRTAPDIARFEPASESAVPAPV